MYLHELGDEAVSYTKEDMIAGRHTADVNVDSPPSATEPELAAGATAPAAAWYGRRSCVGRLLAVGVMAFWW